MAAFARPSLCIVPDEDTKIDITDLITTYFGSYYRVLEIAFEVHQKLQESLRPKTPGSPESGVTTKESSQQSSQSPLSSPSDSQLESVFNFKRLNFSSPANQQRKTIMPHQIVIDDRPYTVFCKGSELFLDDKKDGYFLKTYRIMEKDTYTYLSILREIVLQVYAVEILRDKCKTFEFVIPKIVDYYISSEKDGFIDITIKMEYLEIIPSSSYGDIVKGKEKELYKKMAGFLKCLQDNGIFHNDTHNENLVFIKSDGETPKLALIDFGKATIGSQRFSTSSGLEIVEDEKDETYKDALDKWIDRTPDLWSEHFGGQKIKKYTKRNIQKKRINKKLRVKNGVSRRRKKLSKNKIRK